MFPFLLGRAPGVGVGAVQQAQTSPASNLTPLPGEGALPAASQGRCTQAGLLPTSMRKASHWPRSVRPAECSSCPCPSSSWICPNLQLGRHGPSSAGAQDRLSAKSHQVTPAPVHCLGMNPCPQQALCGPAKLSGLLSFWNFPPQ